MDAYTSQRIVDGTCVPHYFHVAVTAGESLVQFPFHPRSEQMGRPDAKFAAVLLASPIPASPTVLELDGTVVRNSYNTVTNGASSMLGFMGQPSVAPIWFKPLAGDLGIRLRTESGALATLAEDVIIHLVVYEFV